MLAKLTVLLLIFSGSAYADSKGCAKSLKAATKGKLIEYKSTTIGFNSNPSEALQVNTLKSKIIVQASREAAEKHAAAFLLSQEVNLENPIELSLFTNFILGVRDRYLMIYGGATPQIEVKTEVANSEKNLTSSEESLKTADLFGVETNQEFADKKLYEPAFTSSKFPTAIINAANNGLITLSEDKSFEQLEQSLTAAELEGTIQNISSMIYNSAPTVAGNYLKKISQNSKEVNKESETIIGIKKDHSKKLAELEEMSNDIVEMSPAFTNTKNYLAAVASGFLQFSEQDYQEANFKDFNAFVATIFDGSTNEDSYKKLAHDIAIMKMLVTDKPKINDLSQQEYEELKEQYELIFKAPVRIFESYASPDSAGFQIP